MFGILARLLEILYSVWPSYGGSIILFTIVIMLVLAPLTFKSTRSMLAMQALQPEMKKLQNRYKDDRQTLNEEMMKFYKENKISPLGGCLPMLLQFPVFFILYAVLLGLTKRGPFGADLGHSVACSMDGANACTAIGNYANAGFFHPAYLKHTSELYQNLSSTRVMSSFGLDLSQSAWSEFAQGLLHALPYVLMVLFVMGLTYLQQQQIQSRQPKKDDQNPTQQMMMKVMPIAMGFIYIIIPAGVVIYFLVSSVFRIGQQAMVTRTFYTGPNAVAIPTTATEVDDEPAAPKRFWDQFKPSQAALPQVGKDAKQKRAEAFEASAEGKSSGGNGTKSKKPSSDGSGARKKGSGAKSSGSRSSSSKPSGSGKSATAKTGKSKQRPAGSGGGSTKKSASGKATAGDRPKKSTPSGSNGNKGTGSASAKKKTGGREAGKSSGRQDNSADARPSRQAPSRKAPSRQAPKGPSGSKKSGR